MSQWQSFAQWLSPVKFRHDDRLGGACFLGSLAGRRAEVAAIELREGKGRESERAIDPAGTQFAARLRVAADPTALNTTFSPSFAARQIWSGERGFISCPLRHINVGFPGANTAS